MSLLSFQSEVDAVRRGDKPLAALVPSMRALQLPSEVPHRFAEVLADLADRIESSALFSGESCSFSEGDMVDAVETWVRKARRAAGESAS